MTTWSDSASWPLGLDPDNCKVVDIRQQLRSRGYTVSGKGQTKAALLEELRGLVRAEGFAPPDTFDSDDAGGDTAAGEGEIALGGRQRWSPDAGWADRSIMERGEKGFPLCRFCNEEVSSARRTFCSSGCVHEHRIRTQGSYVRKCLLTRDGGKCSVCGIDAAGLYKRARAAWMSGGSVASKRRAVAREMLGTPFEGKVPSEGATRRPSQGKFWHADHIVPVVRGGGQCSLNNYRTLCVPCHATVTKTLAGERAAERARSAASATAARAPGTLGANSDRAEAAVDGTGRAPVAKRKKRGRPRAIDLVAADEAISVGTSIVDCGGSSSSSSSSRNAGGFSDIGAASLALTDVFDREAGGDRDGATGVEGGHGGAGRQRRRGQRQGVLSSLHDGEDAPGSTHNGGRETEAEQTSPSGCTGSAHASVTGAMTACEGKGPVSMPKAAAAIPDVAILPGRLD